MIKSGGLCQAIFNAIALRADMVSIDKVTIHIPWFSMFSGKINVDKFVIYNPDILLEKNRQGQVNWHFAGVPQDTDKSVAIAVEEKSGSKPALPENVDIQLGQVEIIGGKLTYADQTTQQSHVLDQLSLALKLPSLHQPLHLGGDVRYMGQVFKFNATVTTPADVINAMPFAVVLTLDSALITLNYDGKIIQQGQEIQGALTVSGNSVKQLLHWQGIELAAKDNAFNRFELSSNILFANNRIKLDALAVKLDALNFTGQTEILLAEPLMIISAIDLGRLELNPYLPDHNPNDKPDNKPEPGSDAVAVATKNKPLIWAKAELDLSALKLVNATVAVQSSELLVGEIKLGKNQFKVNLKNGKADIQLTNFQGYQGKGTGEIQVNASKKPYQIASQFKLAGIDSEPLLKDAAGFDKLLGTGELGWQLKTQGMSQHDFVNGLNGALNFAFVDGAVKGVNLAALARSAENLIKGNLKAVSLDKDFNHAEKTDFASLSAKFTVNNGIATTRDLALVNPFIRVSGTGDVNLPKTEMNLQVKTKLVASAQGQTAASEGSGLVIPIKIVGPFHQIKIKPDISSSAKDKVKDKLKSKLKDLFGG